ncbi:hypothetical protein [Nonomuraea turkmeniaca]|nr:hypothetical protein [Nonomuraea turkmeniaca]
MIGHRVGRRPHDRASRLGRILPGSLLVQEAVPQERRQPGRCRAKPT